MDEKNSKTPYNSIYETLNSKQEPSELVCCKHGAQCAYGRKPMIPENQYVNLPSPGPGQDKATQHAEKLAAKLKKLDAKGKKTASKEKRKKKAVVKDDHAYEMIGPPSDGGSMAMSAPVTTESVENQNQAVQCENTAYNCYLGVISSADAEAQVSRRGDFALYHEFLPGKCVDNLTAGLPLMLVYYTTTKKHRHYPVRTSGANGEIYYSVDCGYPIVRRHYSLNQLVQYYKTFGSIQINPDDTCAEAFSWWLE